MLERRKKPRIEIWKSSPSFDRAGSFAGRPRKVEVQGNQNPEHSAGGQKSIAVAGWLVIGGRPRLKLRHRDKLH